MSPTQRTLERLKFMNRKCGIVERFIHNRMVKGGIRSDLFGIFDIVALCPEGGIVGVQSCGDDYAAHFKKITVKKADNAVDWLNAGGKIELWSWRKVKEKRGGKRMIWQPRIAEITIADIQ